VGTYSQRLCNTLLHVWQAATSEDSGKHMLEDAHFKQHDSSLPSRC